jgi:hypothetical protein
VDQSERTRKSSFTRLLTAEDTTAAAWLMKPRPLQCSIQWLKNYPYYLSIWLEGLRVTTKKKIQCHSQDSNHKPPEYTSEVSPLQPIYLAIAELKIRVWLLCRCKLIYVCNYGWWYVKCPTFQLNIFMVSILNMKALCRFSRHLLGKFPTCHLEVKLKSKNPPHSHCARHTWPNFLKYAAESWVIEKGLS